MTPFCIHKSFFCNDKRETNKYTGAHGQNQANVFVGQHGLFFVVLETKGVEK